MRIKYLLFLLLLPALQAGAQGRSDTSGVTLQDKAYDRPLFHRPSVLSILVGTQGVGASYKVGLAPQWNLRAGFAIIPFSYDRDFSFGDYKGNAKIDYNPVNVHLLAEFRPFRRSSFRFVGGLAAFFGNKITAKGTPKSNIDINGLELSPEQQGSLQFSVKWADIAPYLGIGLFRSMPGRRFNVTADLGTYYIGKPKGDISGTGTLAANSANNKQFNENISDYRWLPVLQLNFNYKIIR